MRGKRLGFTVTEMLVVLAIIALLALIVMSATIKVRQHFSKKLAEYKTLQVHLAINTTDGSEMLFIPGGKFKMGEGSDKHTVMVGTFYIGKYEVTNRQYQNFVMARPAWQKGNPGNIYTLGHYLDYWSGNSYPAGQASYPVAHVSIFAARAYCEWAGGRLPTEAEWEYACRAGRTTRFCYGDDVSKLVDYAWCSANAGNKTHAVGEKKPSPWGLCDIHGNVLEWTSSIYKPYPYDATDGREDPADTTSWRALRGGSYSDTDICRSAFRFHFWAKDTYDSIGFRLCINADGPTRGELNVMGR